MENLIVVDLEATCWERRTTAAEMEIIEIGAVKLDATNRYRVVDEFQTFVRPTENLVLSDFCRTLTTIEQRNVDVAPYFPSAFDVFLSWISSGSYVWGSWGEYDFNQFVSECDRHDLPMPRAFERHVNLKAVYSLMRGQKKQSGMKKALRGLGIDLDGTPHRGIDDARNIVKIVHALEGLGSFCSTVEAKTKAAP